MKIITVFDLLITPASFLNACDISLACNPTCASPMSPSISALGTNAATESTTITSIAPLLVNASAISNACSPVSGWDTIKLSISTPKCFAYTGSNACSASIKAASPPNFCASAIACNASVVFPDDSGPNTSIILPLGIPPIPNATSKLNAPVGIASIFISWYSPNFIIDPLPNCFSICPNAASNAFFFSEFSLLINFLLHIFIFQTFVWLYYILLFFFVKSFFLIFLIYFLYNPLLISIPLLIF